MTLIAWSLFQNGRQRAEIAISLIFVMFSCRIINIFRFGNRRKKCRRKKNPKIYLLLVVLLWSRPSYHNKCHNTPIKQFIFRSNVCFMAQSFVCMAQYLFACTIEFEVNIHTFGLGLESQRAHLSPCISFHYNTMLKILVRRDSEPKCIHCLKFILNVMVWFLKWKWNVMPITWALVVPRGPDSHKAPLNSYIVTLLWFKWYYILL